MSASKSAEGGHVEAPASPIAAKKHAMTATWHKQDPSTWNFSQRLFIWFDILQQGATTPQPPVHPKTDKVPYYPIHKQWMWIIPRAIVPLAMQRIFMEVTGKTFHPVFAFFYYALAYKFFAIACIRVFNKMGQKYGFLDGDHPRDGVPDQYCSKVFWSLIGTVSIRPLFASFLFYDRNEKPTLSLWFPVQMFMYSIILDFWFYWYHRAMHEVPWLWKHHRLHHVTKHPNPLLSAFASDEQDWGDILIIPLLTWLVFPINFPTWFMAQQMIIYTESMGHSGVRVMFITPMTGYILKYFDMELCLEDHDLHHRNGWKHSFSYGKQTRAWDKIFGSTRDRIECKADNVNFNDAVRI
ncbi:hypothetical protein CBS101457_003781 [Exobasidium rhododendri]|nr:hypothetical protein CBS101457_003781 [Exobasidium rhododendri]